jgi:hypothetical protein
MNQNKTAKWKKQMTFRTKRKQTISRLARENRVYTTEQSVHWAKTSTSIQEKGHGPSQLLPKLSLLLLSLFNKGDEAFIMLIKKL